MDIEVDYKDQRGNRSVAQYHLSRLAFTKHMAFAGQRYSPVPAKLFRALAMFFHYSPYMQGEAFRNSRFSRPPDLLRDPTEQGHFSNMAGKAIADFLSKRIDQSFATMNYEAAMLERGMIVGRVKRPDLIAFTRNAQFAIEAKGRSQGNPGDMDAHKRQSLTGGIKVNFTVACVTYHLFDRVRCNYHDPYNENVPLDRELLQALTRKYYSGLAKYLDNDSFGYTPTVYQGERFYEVDLSRPIRYMLERELLFPFPLDRFEFFRLMLILPGDIRKLASEGLTSESKPFIQEQGVADGRVYIDNDRVGLRIQR